MMGNERIARIRSFVKSIFCSFACHVSRLVSHADLGKVHLVDEG